VWQFRGGHVQHGDAGGEEAEQDVGRKLPERPDREWLHNEGWKSPRWIREMTVPATAAMTTGENALNA